MKRGFLNLMRQSNEADKKLIISSLSIESAKEATLKKRAI